MKEGKDGEATAGTGVPRLPYEKPAVLWEQPLETQPSLMAGCQKQPGAGFDCDSVGGGFS